MVFQMSRCLILTFFHWGFCSDVSITVPTWNWPWVSSSATFSKVFDVSKRYKVQTHYKQPLGGLFALWLLWMVPFASTSTLGSLKCSLRGNKCGLVIEQAFSCPEAQIPTLLSRISSGQSFHFSGLFPGEGKNLYQLFKRRFKDMTDDRVRHRAPSWPLRRIPRFWRQNIFCVKGNIFLSRM